MQRSQKNFSKVKRKKPNHEQEKIKDAQITSNSNAPKINFEENLNILFKELTDNEVKVVQEFLDNHYILAK